MPIWRVAAGLRTRPAAQPPMFTRGERELSRALPGAWAETPMPTRFYLRPCSGGPPCPPGGAAADVHEGGERIVPGFARGMGRDAHAYPFLLKTG